jgi:2-polyprenyl-3-methyl-5-hydroxy-6-metoxy-1,4-benzoquinol methylase
MMDQRWQYTGERLVPGAAWLQPMRIENLARFRFFAQHTPYGRRALDLGCGAGEGTAYLHREHGWDVVGVDVAVDALIMAHKEYGTSRAQFGAMDAGSLAFSDASFDAIVSVEVVEHLRIPQSYLREARRVLRPGGTFLLTTPNRLRSSPRPELRWPEHVREYSPSELLDLLGEVFIQIELWGQHIPVYEQHTIRRFVRKLAPIIKPWLPRWLRVRALPILHAAIKKELSIDDVLFTQLGLAECPTLVAICH